MIQFKLIKRIWQNKWAILSGAWYYAFPTKFIEKIAAERLRICESNICGYYSPLGDDPACTVPGSCCGVCGCSLALKSRSLSSECGIKEKEPYNVPLWRAEMSEVEYDNFIEKTGYKNPHE